MKAIIQNKYGDASNLISTDIEKPTPKDNEVLIEINTVNIASGDMRVNTLDIPFGLKTIMKIMFGFRGPRRKVRGLTASGKIVEVGKSVTKFKVNDKVYVINSMKAGCLAEYLVMNEKGVIAPIPESMNYEESAPLAFGAMSSYHFINKSTVKKNDKVVIYGASGSLGTYAIQLAKYYGAEVTGVCSEKNHDVVLSLGADHVIDYRTNDFTKNNKKYDLVFDTVAKLKKSNVKSSLTSTGKYTSTRSLTSEKVSKLLEINEIINNGGLRTYIEKSYPFDKFKEAHEHVYSKHKVGNVVINMK